MGIVATGIDPATNIFAVLGVDRGGVRPRQSKVRRARLSALMTALAHILSRMDACSGDHYRARKFVGNVHAVRLMATNLVTPYLPGWFGFLRMAQTRPLMVLRSFEPRSLATALGTSHISARPSIRGWPTWRSQLSRRRQSSANHPIPGACMAMFGSGAPTLDASTWNGRRSILPAVPKATPACCAAARGSSRRAAPARPTTAGCTVATTGAASASVLP